MSKQEIPDNYELYFNQVNGTWSIWYAEDGCTNPDLMADGFTDKADAMEYLLCV